MEAHAGMKVRFKKGPHTGMVFEVEDTKECPGDDPLTLLSFALSRAANEKYQEVKISCCPELAKGFWYSWTPDWFEVVE